jgi:uncharacterized protein YjbJ (UPF0337 family)
MNWDQMKGNWREFKGRVKEQWGELTDDDLDRIAGRRDQLLGTLQNRYGRTKEVAEDEIRDFERNLGDPAWSGRRHERDLADGCPRRRLHQAEAHAE